MLRYITATVLAVALAVSPAVARSEVEPVVDAGSSGLHDDGLLWLRVWNTGRVGDIQGGPGSGKYPAPGGPNNVYIGAFWLGASKDGVLRVITDPGYSPGISEWHGVTPVIMSYEPAWSQVPSYIRQEGSLDSYYRMSDADAGENGPIGVACDVHTISWSIQWKTANQDDFVGCRYHLKNNSGSTLEQTYLALAYDFDVGGSLSYIDDKIGFDADRSMPYMYDDNAANPYIGLLPINAAVRGAHAWDIVNDPDSDRKKYALMSEPGFDCERTYPYDWRIILSCGPYTIPPGATQTLTYALVAGMTLEELCANADAALAGSEIGPRPALRVSSAFNLGRNYPNPVTGETTIAFTCPVSARVELAVYDLAGRRIATLTDAIYQEGTYDVTWRPEAVAPGVYVYAMEAAGERIVKTLVVAR